MRSLRVAAVAGVVLFMSGCAHGPFMSMAAPPLVVCGTTLSSSATGAVSYDITHGAAPPVTELTVGDAVYLIVSDNCRWGSHVEISPASAYTILREAKAGDGKPAAVVLTPRRYAAATVTATRGNRVVGSVVLDITAPALNCGLVPGPGRTLPCQAPNRPHGYQVMVKFAAGSTQSDVDRAAGCGVLGHGEGLLADRGSPPHGVVQMAPGGALSDVLIVRDCLARSRGVEAASVMNVPAFPASTPVTTTCGISLVVHLPDGRQINLSSCAGLVGVTSQDQIRIDLKVGQQVSVSVAPGAGSEGWFSDFASSDPTVLWADSGVPSAVRFTARRPGLAEISVTTAFCTGYNGTAAPCPVVPVIVAP